MSSGGKARPCVAWIVAGICGALVAAAVLFVLAGLPWYRAPLSPDLGDFRAMQGMAWQDQGKLFARGDPSTGMLVLRAAAVPPDSEALLAVDLVGELPPGVTGAVYWRGSDAEIQTTPLQPAGGGYQAYFRGAQQPGASPVEFGLVFWDVSRQAVALAGVRYRHDSFRTGFARAVADMAAPYGWRQNSINALPAPGLPGGWSITAFAVLAVFAAGAILAGLQRLWRGRVGVGAGMAGLALAWWVLLDGSWLRTLSHNALVARDAYAGLSQAQRLETQYGELYRVAVAIRQEVPADSNRILLWVDPSQRYARMVLQYLLLPRNVLATDDPVDPAIFRPGDVLVGVGERPPVNWTPARWQEQLRAAGKPGLELLAQGPGRQILRVNGVPQP